MNRPQGISTDRVPGVKWALAAVLAVAAAALLSEAAKTPAAPPAVPAEAPAGQKLLAIAGQVAPDTYGIYLVDPDNSTICLYEWLPSVRKLRLIAARNFAFDRKLDDYNTTPSPGEIRTLVEQNRRLTTAPAQP